MSVLILTNLFMITFVVTDVILRIGKSSQQIGESEIAYLAAESAIEQAIYQIEKEQDAAGLEPAGDLMNVNGSWVRSVISINSMVPTCFDSQNKISFPSDPDTESDKSCVYAQDLSQNPIDQSNPLQVRLKPGKSFEINFNISVPANSGLGGTDFYPNAIYIDWPVSDSSLIILTAGSQTAYNTGGVRIPSSGQMDDSPNYRLRLTNNDTVDVVYSLAPNNADELFPLGISVTATGYYNIDKKERVIVIDRRNWEIY